MTAFHKTTSKGSSPRMRGALSNYVHTVQTLRIIPAYAGSTQKAQGCIRIKTDHPRVCGEHNLLYSVSVIRSGSSPRMRGAPIESILSFASFRIIPAYAGSTQ